MIRAYRPFTTTVRALSLLMVPLAMLLVSTATLAQTMASSVSQHGITWYFDQEYQVGRYANGDWWVLGPVTITRITPESETITDPHTGEDRPVNGSMLNPNGHVNGWDGYYIGIFVSYNQSLDVNPSRNGPLSVATGSIVSSISRISSNIGGSNRAALDVFAILTVVDTAPPSGAFRPNPYGTDKTSYWNESMLDYGVLQSLEPVANTPNLASVTDSVSGFWNDHMATAGTGWFRQQAYTAHTMQRSYGRDIGNQSADALLSLHLNYTNEQKRDLLVHVVQKGIDIYGMQQLSGEWSNNGGHYGSQKARLAFAAIALNDPGMKSALDAADHFVHGMDQQTFFVSQADVDRVSCNDNDPSSTSGNQCGTSGASLYESADLGMPEWGRSHHTAACRFDCRDWGAAYRWIGASYAGNTLAVELLPEARQLWNWEPVFEYSRRYVDVGGSGLSSFVVEMYQNYADLAPIP